MCDRAGNCAKRLGRGLMGLLCLCALSVAAEPPAQLLLLRSSADPPYNATRDALLASLGADWRIDELAPGRLPDELAKDQRDLAVGIGSQACEQLHRALPTTPLLCLLLPRARYEGIIAKQTASAARSALFVDQPNTRQLRIARRLFPSLRRFAVLYSERPPELVGTNLPPAEMLLQKIDNENNLVHQLRQLLPQVDAVLATPDKAIYNRNTLHSVLLTAYRARKPLIGYAKPYVTAGALMSLYTPPSVLGEEAARWLNRWQAGEAELPPASYPRGYTIAINSGIAAALQLPIDANAYSGRLYIEGEKEP
jgi:ABC-type uncharacterized transport system substrate-binding protein